jgi:polyhydroxyalkanoate synthesis regulator phasin
MMRKAIYFGLGVISLSREKAEKIYHEMVEKGEMSKDEARKFIDDAVKRGEEEQGNAAGPSALLFISGKGLTWPA